MLPAPENQSEALGKPIGPSGQRGSGYFEDNIDKKPIDFENFKVIKN